jgi:DNA modification methylase
MQGPSRPEVNKRPLKPSGSGAKGLPWPISMEPINALRPGRRKTRTHPKAQIAQLADAMKRFRVMVPVVVDSRRTIVAGYARIEAAKQAGLQNIPVIWAEHLSDPELRAFSLADNKLAERAGWDREALALELEDLQVVLPEIGLDLSATAFEPGEVDALLDDLGQVRADPTDDFTDATGGPPVSRAGDLFLLDKHRLIVGDAQKKQTFQRLMGEHSAEMVFADPPYNVTIAGHVGGRGRTKHREFRCASGEMSSSEFEHFLRQTLGLCARHSTDGSIQFVCIDWRHAPELHRAGATVFDELKNMIVWVKSNPGQGTFYRSQHELIFAFKHGTAPHVNTFRLGATGRSRSNVWRYAGMNTFRAGRMDELRMHPTVKPVALVADAMRDCSRRGAIVLDPFAGSGTTIMAAEQIGRRAFCIEIDPQYADVAIRRWQSFTKRDAILESTGGTFDDLLKERSAPAGRRPEGSRPPS